MIRDTRNALLSVQAAVAGVLAGEPGDWTVQRRPDGDVQEPFATVSAMQPPTTGTDDVRFPLLTLPVTVACYLKERESAAAAEDAAAQLADRLWRLFLGGEFSAVAPRALPFFDWSPATRVDRVDVVLPRYSFAWEIPEAVRLSSSAGTVVVPLPLTTAAEEEVQGPVQEVYGERSVLARRHSTSFEVEWEGDAGSGLQVEMVGSVGRASVRVRNVRAARAAPWRGASDVLRVDAFGAQVVADPDVPTKAMVMGDLRCTFRRGMAVPSSQTYVRRIGARFDPIE